MTTTFRKLKRRNQRDNEILVVECSDETFYVEMLIVDNRIRGKGCPKKITELTCHRNVPALEDFEEIENHNHVYQYEIFERKIRSFCENYNKCKEAYGKDYLALNRLVHWICGCVKVFRMGLIEHHYLVICDFGTDREYIYRAHLTSGVDDINIKHSPKALTSWNSYKNEHGYSLLFTSHPFKEVKKMNDIRLFCENFVTRMRTCQGFASDLVNEVTGEDLRCQLDCTWNVVGATIGGSTTCGFLGYGFLRGYIPAPAARVILPIAGAGATFGGYLGGLINETKNHTFDNEMTEVRSECSFDLFIGCRRQVEDPFRKYIIVVKGEDEGFITKIEFTRNNNNIISTTSEYLLEKDWNRTVENERIGSIGIQWDNIEERSINYSYHSNDSRLRYVQIKSFFDQLIEGLLTNQQQQRNNDQFPKFFLKTLFPCIQDVFFEDENIEFPPERNEETTDNSCTIL